MRLRGIIVFGMRHVVVGLAIAFVVVAIRPGLLGYRPPGDSDRISYAAAVERAAPAVVNIQSTKRVPGNPGPLIRDPFFRRFFGDAPGSRPRIESSLGSGVVVGDGGYVLTNYHVIEGAEQIAVMLHDGRSTTARVVGSDPETDLSVLRVELAGVPTIQLADPGGLHIGDVVLAIGNPFGVGQTVTMGIVSASGRDRLGINTFEDFIQTDAAINPGNSGGALIDQRGRLVGINTAIYSRSGGSQGIGFAIPADLAVDVMRQLVERGYVARGWLGMEVAPHPEGGVVVTALVRGGPGDRAGLRPGDRVTGVDGKPVASPREAVSAVARVEPGGRVTLDVMRDGRSRSIQATPGQRPVMRRS